MVKPLVDINDLPSIIMPNMDSIWLGLLSFMLLDNGKIKF